MNTQSFYGFGVKDDDLLPVSAFGFSGWDSAASADAEVPVVLHDSLSLVANEDAVVRPQSPVLDGIDDALAVGNAPMLSDSARLWSSNGPSWPLSIEEADLGLSLLCPWSDIEIAIVGLRLAEDKDRDTVVSHVNITRKAFNVSGSRSDEDLVALLGTVSAADWEWIQTRSTELLRLVDEYGERWTAIASALSDGETRAIPLVCAWWNYRLRQPFA